MKDFDDEFKDFDKKFRRTRIVRFVFLLAMSTGLCMMLYFPIQREKEHDKKIKSNLGRKILFDKDSVIITAYDREENYYILSNGQKIDFSLVNKQCD